MEYLLREDTNSAARTLCPETAQCLMKTKAQRMFPLLTQIRETGNLET
jgi:hypothetical protein